MFTCEYFFSDVPNVVVIVTDGESNIQNTQTLPEARLLQNTGATLITVAVGFTEVSAELTGLTSEPVTENLIRVDNYDSLSQLRNKLVEPLCTGMIINILLIWNKSCLI